MKINNLDKFRATVASGKTALGCVINSLDPSITELIADAGADFVWIDAEHSPMNIETTLAHIMATRGTNCAPFVRVPWNIHWLMKPILELAPAGIIIPLVTDAQQVRDAVAACRYPVHGGVRGVGPRRSNRYGFDPFPEYLEESAHDPLIILQMEHRDAYENIDEILEVPGWDSICIGPYDFSMSYGKPSQFHDPEVEHAIRTVCAKAQAAGKMLGGFASPAHIFEGLNVNWRALGGDLGFLAQAFSDELAKFRK